MYLHGPIFLLLPRPIQWVHSIYILPVWVGRMINIHDYRGHQLWDDALWFLKVFHSLNYLTHFVRPFIFHVYCFLLRPSISWINPNNKTTLCITHSSLIDSLVLNRWICLFPSRNVGGFIRQRQKGWLLRHDSFFQENFNKWGQALRFMIKVYKWGQTLRCMIKVYMHSEQVIIKSMWGR